MSRKRTSSTASTTSIALLAIVLVIAGGLRAISWIQGEPDIPRADVPAVAYEETPQVEPEVIPAVPDTPDTPVTPAQDPSEAPTPEIPSATATIPASYNLAIPFASQAPFHIWDAFHEETCEEAAVLMALAYYDRAPATPIDPQQVDDRLHEMVAWQESQGMEVSISIAELQRFLAHEAPTRMSRVIENPTAAQLREELAAGHPIIVPAAGRRLDNPFFTGEGPVYHMLILRGYTPEGFITNDPGTQHGEGYVYSDAVLLGAIADWNAGDPEHGPQRVLVILP